MSSLVSEFLSWFKFYCYNNDQYGRAAFHVALGQLLKEQKIVKGGRRLDGRFNIFVMGLPSSGKSAGMDPIMHIMGALGMKTTHPDDFSDVSLVGNFESIKVKEGDKTVTRYEFRPGAMSDCDILYLDEASVLFAKNPPQYATKAKTFLQKALNPLDSKSNAIEITRRSGQTAEIHPHCSIYLTSFPLIEMEDVITRTGMLQRMFILNMDDSEDVRHANDMMDIDMLGVDVDVSMSSEIVERFAIIKETFTGSISWEWNVAKPVLRKSVDQLHSMKTHSNETVKRIMMTFIPRYKDMLYVLSMHHAVMRMEEVMKMDFSGPVQIEVSDVQYARNMVLDSMSHILSVIERSYAISKQANIDKSMTLRTINLAYRRVPNDNKDEEGNVPMDDLLQQCIVVWGISRESAKSKLREYKNYLVIESKKVGDKTKYMVRPRQEVKT